MFACLPPDALRKESSRPNVAEFWLRTLEALRS